MTLPVMLMAKAFEGRFVRLEPLEPRLKEEVRGAIDCEPETWTIIAINPIDRGFEEYWCTACGAPVNERIAYAIRRRSDGIPCRQEVNASLASCRHRDSHTGDRECRLRYRQ